MQMHIQAEVAAESLDRREHPGVQRPHGAGTTDMMAAHPEAVAAGMRSTFAVAAVLIVVALGVALASARRASVLGREAGPFAPLRTAVSFDPGSWPGSRARSAGAGRARIDAMVIAAQMCIAKAQINFVWFYRCILK